MNAYAYTPGPWSVDENTRAIVGPDFGSICASAVATVVPRHATFLNDTPQSSRLRAEANARLIAAAPQLVEVLTLLRDTLNAPLGCTKEERMYATLMADAVLATAVGEA